MSDSTKKIFVRLRSDFPAGQERRRAGLVIGAGGMPQEIEVTSEQHDAIKADQYIEIMSDKQVKKLQDRFPKPVEEPIDEAASSEGDDQENTDDTDDSDEGKAEEAASVEGDETPHPEPLAVMSFEDLKARAVELKIENVDKLRSKQAVIDAIEAASSEE